MLRPPQTGKQGASQYANIMPISGKFQSKHTLNDSVPVEISGKSGPPPDEVLFDRWVWSDRNLPFLVSSPTSLARE